MSISAPRVSLTCLVGLLLIPFAAQAEPESPKPSYALFAPSQNQKTINSLANLFTDNDKNATVTTVKTLPDAIASKAEILVLALNVGDFNALGPYDADALKKRTMVGIGFGAAKLFGELKLKISGGNCAHGFEPRIRAEDNATVDKAGFDQIFGVYAPNAPNNPAGDIDFMPFGIYLGDKHPEIRVGLDVIAQFSNDVYTPVVRQGNALLIGFNPRAEDWSPLFRSLVAKSAAALITAPATQAQKQKPADKSEGLAGEWFNAASGLKLKIAPDAKGWSIQAWAGSGRTPAALDWGSTRFSPLGDSVSAKEFSYGFATWEHGFKTAHLTARLDETDQLAIECYSIFKDGSGRSNYRTTETLTRVREAKVEAANLKRVPNFFAWDYTSEPEPGKRVWLRVDDKTFVERYPSGHENRFAILKSQAVNDIDGVIVKIADSEMQAFIPYKAIADSAAKSAEAKPAAEPPQLLMRADEAAPWQEMGTMTSVE